MAQQPVEETGRRVRLQEILVPTDFSPLANHALDHAIYLAKRYKARLTLVHVMAPYFGGTEADMMSIPSAYYGRELMGILEERLNEVGKKGRDEGIEVNTILTMGVPFVEIVRIARQKKMDLIVVSTHGRTGLKHAILGSTAERVVRKAPCPVLSVRPPDTEA